MTIEKIKTSLHDIAYQEIDSLRKEVALEALDHDDISTFFSDLLNHGCVCGIIGKLTYYKDTHAFFDKYYDDIEELRVEFEENHGYPLQIKSDLKNNLAWFVLEESAHQIASELIIYL